METSNGTNQTRFFVGAGIILVLVIIGIWQFFPRADTLQPIEDQLQPLPIQIETATSSAAKAVLPDSASRPIVHPLPLAEGDSIASWDFKGAYAANLELTAKAQSEILRLSDLLITATSSKMILSVGVANQYELLGDGKKQYEYLGRAILADVENGLPLHNLGVLMERLGAYKTARIAYEKSTRVQPGFKFYHYAYIEFLTTRMKDDRATIEKAFSDAEKSIGQTPYLAELRAEWEKS